MLENELSCKDRRSREFSHCFFDQFRDGIDHIGGDFCAVVGRKTMNPGDLYIFLKIVFHGGSERIHFGNTLE